jgi:glycosyltransferase involved in cell wall biosynthesis
MANFGGNLYVPVKTAQVAVLMAVHKGADVAHLAEALRSLRTQTYPNIRLFVYCDGPLSPEHERELSSYLNLSTNQDILIRGSHPLGLPTGLNCLIDEAMQHPEIQYLARMDSDDISLPERVGRQVEFLRQHSNVSIVGTWCIEFTEPSVPLFHKKLPTNEAEVKKFMLFRSPLVHPTVMFRRSVFEEGHRYDVELTMMQDYELWSRLVIAGHRISNVPEFLLWYRMAEGFFSRRTGSRRARKEVLMRIQYARQAGLLHPLHYFKYAAFFLLRISPVWVKRLSYMHLR